jgi:glutathione synthase/RimK-type ligase-like ATP-grasp enzyme
MRVVFATCGHQPLISPDDQVLADALAARGVDVEPIPWTEIDPYAVLDAPPILLRSTWDYHRVPTMFRSWLQALEDSGRRVWNPPVIARANVDKIYLKDLETRGIAIPKTRWLDAVDLDSIRRVLDEEKWPRAVLKPRIAATAYGTFLIDRDTELADEDLQPARASGALLQELISEVADHGETSLMLFDGAFSHAVLKRAKPGEFRVQKDFGGRVEPTSPSNSLLDVATRVMTLVPEGWLCARVDVVETATGPLLMELELIEPELYFLYVPEAAARFAAVLARVISS